MKSGPLGQRIVAHSGKRSIGADGGHGGQRFDDVVATRGICDVWMALNVREYS